MNINWRPYQVECKEKIKEKFKAGITEQLIVQATGTGKRLAAVDIMKHFKRSLFIAHREELIMQAYEEISQIYPMQVGIVKGSINEFDKKIVVASVQTLYNRLDKIHPEAFGYIAIDEVHHYASRTFLATARHFRPKLLTGWTATPKRLDGMSLSNLFQEMVFEYRIADGIKENYLAKIDAYQIQTAVELKGVKKVAGDFNQRELSERVDIPKRNQLIVEKYKQYAEGRQAIAFCVDIDHSYNLKQHFINAGISCESVNSNTERCPNRSEIIERFQNGEIDVLTNVEILCLDMRTEILTARGWLKHDQMKKSDLVANYTIDGKVFFKKPEEIVKRQLYDFEKMVTIKTKQTDIRITNTHRIIYKTGTNGVWHKTAAQNLIGKKWMYPSCGEAEPLKFEMEQPYIISESAKKRMVTATSYNLRKKNGYGHFESRVEAKKRCEKKLSLRYKNPDELSLNECKLIGFWLGDGSMNRLIRRGIEYTLCQSKVYPNIVNYIDNILKESGIDNIKRDKGNYYVWSLPRGTGSGIQSKSGIFHLEPYLDKNGSTLLWGLSKLQLSALIEGLWYADENHGKAESITKTKIIGSTFYNLLSLLQGILVCRGFKANMKKTNQGKKSVNNSDLYVLTIEQRKVQSVMSDKDEYRMNYDLNCNPKEQVWCVKTESKNIITRRNGRVCIMGNTEGFDYNDVGCVIAARPTQSESLYVQTIGRGTRLKSDAFKERFPEGNCIILDFVDNTAKHSLVNSYSLEEDVPLEDKLFLPKEHKEMLLEAREKRIREMKVRDNKDRQVDLLKLPRVRVWNSEKMLEPATEKQIEWIKSLGLYQEDVEYTKMMASEVITNSPAKSWQIRWLQSQGYDVSGNVSNGQYQVAKKAYEMRNKFSID